MVIKSCPLLVKDTETCVGSSLASYFVLFSLISLVSFYFVFISLISFRFVFVDFVSFRFVSFSLISFRFVSFRFYFVSHFIGTPCQKAYLPNPVVFFMLIGNGNGLYFPEIYINRFVFQNMWICICILRVYFRILKYMIKWSWKWDLRTLITNDI